MKWVLVWAFSLELMLALRLGTAGDWWAARAARRLEKAGRKFSGKLSGK